jgi:hypothetical protein
MFAAIRRASSLVSTWLLIFAEPILWCAQQDRPRDILSFAAV